jgi:hypothetical protein
MTQQLTEAPAFIPLPAYIFADRRLSVQDKITWGGVVALCGDGETVFDDHPLLQRLIKDNYENVQKALNHLVELRLLIAKKEGNRSFYEPLKNALLWHPVDL